jgi:hypothetical protein
MVSGNLNVAPIWTAGGGLRVIGGATHTLIVVDTWQQLESNRGHKHRKCNECKDLDERAAATACTEEK